MQIASHFNISIINKINIKLMSENTFSYFVFKRNIKKKLPPPLPRFKKVHFKILNGVKFSFLVYWTNSIISLDVAE